mmetsp:Transcript_4556/g.6923  ORF Transcript_4556/g.6923 Transcript_4556/m.6923 type:complete len:377 (-) Transcript_4556:127-1257(-)|eukprot:CAMPEP_0195283326 /NCGR_PEP_ID=MMETSP0707-20130614/1911_1 /TAXON_ID=33640 /ORGANISM="Asterionellopsis glacialis, Strain CCMP134" /LENGTH=376 /DNA_ID=CAMNT_0040342473 /DNA_START=13 /DNA_END=1143 /DNA_ORIENTATION=-
MTSYSLFSAPAFSPDQIAEEINSLPEEDQKAIEDDAFCRNLSELKEEENREINFALIEEFAESLDRIPDDEKLEYLQAVQECPELVERESSTIKCLRARYYDVEEAAKLLVSYWKQRVFIFKDKAFLPMTLSGAMSDDVELMADFPNLIRILPNDKFGRTVIFRDPTGVDFGAYHDGNSMIRITWYVFHLALEKESTQTLGIVYLSNHRPSRLHHFNPRRAKVSLSSLRIALPIRIRAVHIIRPHALYLKTLEVVAFLAGQHFRTRMKWHLGSADHEVNMSLEKYGIYPESLPTTIGGTLDRETRNGQKLSWVEEQLYMEMEVTSSGDSDPEEDFDDAEDDDETTDLLEGLEVNSFDSDRDEGFDNFDDFEDEEPE